MLINFLKMEKNVVEEQSCDANDCKVVTESSSGQIAVEFVNAAEKKETEQCRHFSIRGYVAEIRRKDWKLCWPFSSLGDYEESKPQPDLLPSLCVPDFKWWGCPTCRQHIDASDDAAVVRMASNLSGDKIYEARTSDVNTTVHVIGSECCQLLHGHIKENLAIFMSNVRQDACTVDHNNIEARGGDKIIEQPNFCEMKNVQLVSREVNKDAEAISLDLENTEISTIDKTILNITSSYNEVLQKEKIIPGVPKVAETTEQEEVLKCHQKADERVPENSPLNSFFSFQKGKINPLVFEGTDKVQDVNIHDELDEEHGDSSHALSSRKPRKFRLLADIIRGEVSDISTKACSSHTMTYSDNLNTKVTKAKAADELDGLVLNNHDSTGRFALEESFEKSKGNKNRKRKMPKAEDQEFLQTTWLKGISENVVISKKDQDHNCFKVSESKSVTDAFVQEDLQSGFNIHYSDNRIDGKVTPSKRKNKTTWFEDVGLCLKPWEKFLCRELQLVSKKVECKGSSAGIRPLSNSGFTDGGVKPYPNLNVAAEENNNRSFPKNNNNFMEDVQPASVPLGVNCGILSEYATYRKTIERKLQTSMAVVEGDSSTTYQNVMLRSSATDIVPTKTAKKITFGRGCHNSASCCMGTKENDIESTLGKRKCDGHQVEHGLTSAFIHHEGMSKEGCIISKGVEINRPEATGTSLRDSVSNIQGRDSPIRPKELPLVCNYENMEIKGNSEAIRNENHEGVHKMGELESSTDIPIEIVELLAKNRHERRRLESESTSWTNFSISETTKNMKNYENFKFSGANEDEMPRDIWHKKLELHRPQSSKAQDAASARGIGILSEQVQKSVPFPSLIKETCTTIGSEMNHLKEPRYTESFAFSVSAVKNSNGNLFSEVGTGYGWPMSCLQSLTSHPEHQTVSCQKQIRAAPHVSLLNVANYRCRNESTQKFTNSFPRQNMNLDFRTVGRMRAKQLCACSQKKIGNFPKPVDPLELYTNETMPATQLLKLMDAGMKSIVSQSVDEDVEFAKDPLTGRLIQNPSRRSMSICFGKDYREEKADELCSPLPALDSVVSRVGRNMGKVSKILQPETVKPIKKMKRKKSTDFPTEAVNYELHGSGFQSGSLDTNNGLLAGFRSSPDSMILPSKSYLMEDSVGNVEVDRKFGTLWLVRGSCGSEICTLNRNPADFSIPEAGNEFMIGFKDINRKKYPKRGRPRLRKMNLLALREPEHD
ncbi:hypothetical protein NMG60_11002577 [Bertholletia excelsa]